MTVRREQRLVPGTTNQRKGRPLTTYTEQCRCGLWFSHKGMGRHIKSCTRDTPAPVVVSGNTKPCVMCGKPFPSLEAVKKHTRYCDGERAGQEPAPEEKVNWKALQRARDALTVLGNAKVSDDVIARRTKIIELRLEDIRTEDEHVTNDEVLALEWLVAETRQKQRQG